MKSTYYDIQKTLPAVTDLTEIWFLLDSKMEIEKLFNAQSTRVVWYEN